ncbi:hypothetical protein ACFQ1L_23240 [Phytohabitans flavus]|uniref:hypothetical protein n=1 Tax=Phytohabitans flavus TaxID=1076124 RepID=UPI00363B6C31
MLVADGPTGWAFVTPRQPAPVGNNMGLPWGETGALSVIETNLTSVFAQDAPPVSLGDSAHWYVNENNAVRRLLDQDSPTGSMPMMSVGKEGCVVVLGQYSSKAPLGASSSRPGGLSGSGRHQNVRPWQVICTVRPGSDVRHSNRRESNWLYQAVHHAGRWYVATATGLEVGALEGNGELLTARPRAGAMRWFAAGQRIYAIGVEQVVPSRGVWIAVLENGALRPLLHEPRTVLLGHLTSTYVNERPCVVADGDTLWVAVSGENGRTRILHVTPDGTRELRSAPGWLEPVARIPSGLLCLHALETRPGEGRQQATRLVHLPV